MGKGASAMRSNDPSSVSSRRLDTDSGSTSADTTVSSAPHSRGDLGDAESPEAIRREIAETRDEMSETVDAIQEKLAPDVLVEQAKDAMSQVTEHAVQEAKERAQEAIREVTEMAKEAVREATVGKAEDMIGNATDSARDTSESIMQTIRANPIPAAIAAVSLGWLFTKRSHKGYYEESYFNKAYGYDEKRGVAHAAGNVAGKVQDKVEETASQASDVLGDVASKAGHTVSSAGDMLGGAATGAGRTSKDVGTTIMDTITANPLPAAVTGIGLAWLWMRRSQTAQPTYGSHHGYAGATYQSSSQASSGGIGSMAGDAQDKVQEFAVEAQDRVESFAGQAQDTASNLADDARHQAGRMQTGVGGMLQENPLMVGLVAAAAGAAVGMAIPSTPQENRLLGDTRQSFMETAKETVHEVSEKVQKVAEETQTAAQNAASEQKLTA